MGHRGSYAKGFVNSAEVVERVPQRHGSPVVLPFLAEGVRQASEATTAHTHAKIAAFDD